MSIKIHQSMQEVEETQWNALIQHNYPFFKYAFLDSLEHTQCINVEHYWQTHHFCLYQDTQLIAALPCYVKYDSYGEYIFDWSWADAYQRYGMQYYPKLVNAIPFTPATGPRILLRNPNDQESVCTLINASIKYTQEHNISSFHSLFINQQQFKQWNNHKKNKQKESTIFRLSNQYHWKNQNYQDFDDFLNQLNAKKRKNIRQERRKIFDANVEYRWLNGTQCSEKQISTMYGFYQNTLRYYQSHAYLNESFFQRICQQLGEQTLLCAAYVKEEMIACALYFKSDQGLYGRYWGAKNQYHSLHFETCYYQAIEYCIKHQLHFFEAGAQGEHKLSRGLNPTPIHSIHWIKHPQMRVAIEHFVQQETEHITQYQQHKIHHSAFKKNSPVSD